MRSLKFGGLFLLAGALSFACNGEDNGGPDGTGGSGTGGTVGTGGSGLGGSGATDSGTHPGCVNTITASGAPKVIDDFDHGTSWAFSEDSDGRVGAWEHEYAASLADGREVGSLLCGDPSSSCYADMGAGGANAMDLTPGWLQAKCEAGDGWCDGGEPDASDAWGNWAAISTPLVPWTENAENCYDASMYTGIRFKAWSSMEGMKLRMQVVDPDANVADGITYQKDGLTAIKSDTKPDSYIEVPFTALKKPGWITDGTASAPIDPRALQSISFAIRVTSPESGDQGEKIAPYEINLDDVEFY